MFVYCTVKNERLCVDTLCLWLVLKGCNVHDISFIFETNEHTIYVSFCSHLHMRATNASSKFPNIEEGRNLCTHLRLVSHIDWPISHLLSLQHHNLNRTLILSKITSTTPSLSIRNVWPDPRESRPTNPMSTLDASYVNTLSALAKCVRYLTFGRGLMTNGID